MTARGSDVSGPPLISMAWLSFGEKAAFSPAAAVVSLNITADLNIQSAHAEDKDFP